MVEIFKISSLEEYIRVVDQLQGYYFRGQSDGKNWELIPKIFRIAELCDADGNAKKDWISIEDEILNRFQRLSIKYLKNYPKDKLEWLVIGQHFGLPTRLLDWTINPLVGLFFALNEQIEEENVVYALSPTEIPSESNYDIESLHEMIVYFPRLIEERIGLQGSCFTVQPFPEKNEKFKSLETLHNENTSNYQLKRIEIEPSPQVRRNILKGLFYLGISNDFIYSDIEGICKDLVYSIKEDLLRF